MSDEHAVIAGAEAWSSPGQGERARIGLVLSHGFTGNPCSTRPLGELLAQRGFAVEVVRLPGHGTHWRDMMATRYRDWTLEVESALDRLRGDDKRVVLVGLSMGGTIALDLACQRPDDVAGVVPINCTVLDREGLLAKMAPLLEKVLPVVPAGAAGLIENDIARGGDEKAYGMVPAAAGNSFLVELPRIRRALTSLEVPVLVAWSPQDHSVPPENSIALARMLDGPVEKLPLERSYHVATLDYDQGLLADRIADFAERVTASAGRAGEEIESRANS